MIRANHDMEEAVRFRSSDKPVSPRGVQVDLSLKQGDNSWKKNLSPHSSSAPACRGARESSSAQTVHLFDDGICRQPFSPRDRYRPKYRQFLALAAKGNSKKSLKTHRIIQGLKARTRSLMIENASSIENYNLSNIKGLS